MLLAPGVAVLTAFEVYHLQAPLVGQPSFKVVHVLRVEQGRERVCGIAVHFVINGVRYQNGCAKWTVECPTNAPCATTGQCVCALAYHVKSVA